jgi:hypothetical protein
MKAWLFPLLLVCVLVLFFLLRPHVLLRPHEGFDGTIPEYAADAKLLANQTQFAGLDSIYVNKALDPTQQRMLNKALAQPDPFVEQTPKQDYSALFVENPVVAFTDKDTKLCKKATHPSQLLASVGTSKVRCGWWYVDDPNTPSVGAIGNYQGPIFPNTLPRGGVWMWNLVEAGKKEDIKRCKRLRSCAWIDFYNALPGVRCGFCTALGSAVPVDGSGNVLYPEATGCDEAVTTASQCPAPGDGGGGGKTVRGPTGDAVVVDVG